MHRSAKVERATGCLEVATQWLPDGMMDWRGERDDNTQYALDARPPVSWAPGSYESATHSAVRLRACSVLPTYGPYVRLGTPKHCQTASQTRFRTR